MKIITILSLVTRGMHYGHQLLLIISCLLGMLPITLFRIRILWKLEFGTLSLLPMILHQEPWPYTRMEFKWMKPQALVLLVRVQKLILEDLEMDHIGRVLSMRQVSGTEH